MPRGSVKRPGIPSRQRSKRDTVDRTASLEEKQEARAEATATSHPPSKFSRQSILGTRIAAMDRTLVTYTVPAGGRYAVVRRRETKISVEHFPFHEPGG